MANDVLEEEIRYADREFERIRLAGGPTTPQDIETIRHRGLFLELKARRDQQGFTFGEYQACTTRSITLEGTPETKDVLAMWTLCLCGEAGELANEVKKVMWHKHVLDVDKIRDELGDILWYLSAAATCLGIDLEDVARTNLKKIQKRYPEGFDPERSKNRGSE